MFRVTRIVVAVVLAALPPTTRAAQPNTLTPRKNKPLEVSGLYLLEGDMIGSAGLKEAKSIDKTLPRVPRNPYVEYIWDGSHLRVHSTESGKRSQSKDAIAKDGWYLTADYSTKPPRVIVTERPTSASTWQFVAASEWDHFYLKNENSPDKKDAWLLLEKRDKRYWYADKGFPDLQGKELDRYWEGTVWDAVLTYDMNKRRAFHVADIEQEDGK
jgi:hypothetical protein